MQKASRFHLLVLHNPVYLHSHPHLETKLWACPPTCTYCDFTPLPQVLTQLISNDCLHENSLLCRSASILASTLDKGGDLDCRTKFCMQAMSDSKKLLSWEHLPCRSVILHYMYSHCSPLQLGVASTAISKLFCTTVTSLTVWEPRNESTSSDTPLWVKVFFTVFTPGDHKHLVLGQREKKRVTTFSCLRMVLCL